MLFGLGELISDARLDEGGLDAFLADARALADARLAARSGERELAMSAELADRIA